VKTRSSFRDNQHQPPPPPKYPPHLKTLAGEHPAVTDDVLARYLLEGDVPLEDERLCLCGHLEADHRALSDKCSRCVRCTGFAVEPSWDITVKQPVPTEEEMRAELAATRARREAQEAEIVAAAEGRR